MNILIADDDALAWATYLQTAFGKDTELVIHIAENPNQCREVIRNNAIDLILLDIYFASTNQVGFDVLDEVQAAYPDIKVIMFSNADDHETMVTAKIKNAGYLSKTRNSLGEIASYIEETLHADEISKANSVQMKELAKAIAVEVGAKFVSEQMLEVFQKVALARKNTDVHVLIQGEQGVGKELIARAISRAGIPFQSLNCAGITETLLQSELFGHEKGAFTGSCGKTRGLIGEASGGDLFLDEFGDLSLGAQAALLRAVEYGEVKQVGASKSRSIKFRVIAATNANLEEKVEKAEFRSDFLSRFSRLVIKVPPLRDRPEDILPIVNCILAEKAPEQRFSRDCQHIFESYDWPGNVRELRSVILQVLDRNQRSILTVNELPNEFLKSVQKRKNPPEFVAQGGSHFFVDDQLSFADQIRQFESFIIKNHAKMLGNKLTQSALAQSLDMPRTNLRRKIDELELNQMFIKRI